MENVFNYKLLVCMVGRNKGDKLMTVAKRAGARGGTVILGRSFHGSRVLQALSLADVMQDIVFTLLRDETEAVLNAITTEAGQCPGKLGGKAMLLDVPNVLSRVSSAEQKNKQPEGAKMESGYQLITVIVNSGYGDDVMETARKAGAHGGTILSARGTGTEEDVKFFGLTLVPEKDMLLIVGENEKTEAILAAIGGMPLLNQPGGGIVYCMNVEKFIRLGDKTENCPA